ncbi:MAG: histidinol dehydrogenase [Phycisphaerae bacterium]|nr:histidinol dehydrogenase [Phycisphaerae bacterium]
MRVLYTGDQDFESQFGRLRAPLLPEQLLFERRQEMAAVEETISRVRRDGDRALCELTQRFDNANLTPEQIRVDRSVLTKAADDLEPELRSAIELSIANVRRYQEHLKVWPNLGIVRPGVELRTRYRPINRVGVYVPGGSAPLFSTLIMTAVPAQVAGVRQIGVASPPRYSGQVHPVMLGVCGLLGIDEVYQVGGAQAIAAMALGTETIQPVDKILGPGNTYVQLAKKAVFGIVDVESFAGQTEIVVIADETAQARFVAADMIGQAEHAPGSALLLTPSRELAQRVTGQIDVLLQRSARSEATRKCLDESSAIVVTESLDEAVALSNRIAPEHLSVQTKDPDAVAQRCENAGAIFVGAFTSEAVGDYVAGPSHVLPTGGTARFFSPLNVMDFMRHTSVIKYDRSALRRVYPALEAMTQVEQLPGHLLSATVRLED